MEDNNSPVYRRQMAQKSAQQAAPQMREFTVGNSSFDEDFEPSPIDLNERVKEAHKQKSEYVDRVSPMVKQSIELLSNLGRQTQEVKIGEAVFSLQTLKSKENKEAVMASILVSTGTQLESAYEVRRQQLARSIFKIDGLEMYQVLGNNSLQAKLNLVDEMEENVVSKLFSEFEKLKEKTKFPETMEEVVEAIKK